MILFVAILNFLFVIGFSFCDKKVPFSRIPAHSMASDHHIVSFCDYLIPKPAAKTQK